MRGWQRIGNSTFPRGCGKRRYATCPLDIELYRAAAIAKVEQCIYRRTKDKSERQGLFRKLKDGSWVRDQYLRSRMRKYFRHGHTRVKNQIVLDVQCYKWFARSGKGWIDVISLTPRKRIAIPLNTTRRIKGTIRLILRDGRVEVHHTVDAAIHCKTTPCGTDEVGIDKGYSEAFVDSDGTAHGKGLGNILSAESDALKLKYQRRNKLKSIIDKKPHQRVRILKNNLRRKKLNRRAQKHRSQVKTKIYNAVHTIVDKAKTIACEDLTKVIKSKHRGKNTNRRLNGWVKGIIATSLEQVSLRRGAAVVLVNAAYTSQTCSQCECLGTRRGDAFYCTSCRVVLHADHNAALNIKARLHDKEICRWTPYREVKSILLERQRRRLNLLNQDSRHKEGGRRRRRLLKPLSPSESELPDS